MARVEGRMPDEDLVVDVVYCQTMFKLTISYVLEDGTAAHAEYQADLIVGENFAVESPEINGYQPDLPLISGEMPDQNLNYTVIYKAQKMPVEPDTTTVPLSAATVPLGIGNVAPSAGDCFDCPYLPARRNPPRRERTKNAKPSKRK